MWSSSRSRRPPLHHSRGTTSEICYGQKSNKGERVEETRRGKGMRPRIEWKERKGNQREHSSINTRAACKQAKGWVGRKTESQPNETTLLVSSFRSSILPCKRGKNRALLAPLVLPLRKGLRLFLSAELHGFELLVRMLDLLLVLLHIGLGHCRELFKTR